MNRQSLLVTLLCIIAATGYLAHQEPSRASKQPYTQPHDDTKSPSSEPLTQNTREIQGAALPPFNPAIPELASLKLEHILDQRVTQPTPSRIQRETLLRTAVQEHPRLLIREHFSYFEGTATALGAPQAVLAGHLSLTPIHTSAPPLELAAFCAEQNWELRKPYAFSPQLTITLPVESIAAHTQAFDKLRTRYDKHLSLNEAYLLTQPTATPNDPKYTDGTLWHLSTIDAAAAWNLAQGNSQSLLGIIDFGINTGHEDLADNIATNPNETPANSLDDDGNGLVDDVSGWNFNNNTADIGNSSASHGSQVSGVVAAVGNNALGITGVAWQASLLSIKMEGANTTEFAPAYDYITHLKTTYRLPVLATNNSYVFPDIAPGGSPPTQPQQAIERARDAGILFVAGAGNDARDTDTHLRYPAGYSTTNLINATATNQTDTLWTSSPSQGANWGATSIDLAAPGDTIYSTSTDNTYSTNSGTSLASPMVVGTLVLMKDANPALDASTLKSILMNTVTPLSALSGKCVSQGRLNTYAAVETALLYPQISLQHPGTPALIPSGGSFSLHVSAEDYDGTISEVRFFLNSTLTHTDTDGSDGYTYQWTPPANGMHSLIIEAEDNTGNITRTDPFTLHSGTLTIDDAHSSNLSINTWFDAAALDAYQGTQQQAAPDANNRFNFFPNIPFSSDYELALHWSTGTWANNATLEIKHGSSSATTTVNQSTNQGTWNTIGTYSFTQGQNAQHISLQSQGANANVVADAMRLTPTAFNSGDDSVSLFANTPLASESDLHPASFTFVRSGTTNPLTVNYSVSGSATAGIDYTSLSGQITIPDGSLSTTLTLTPKSDSDNGETPETVTLTLQPGTGYLPANPSEATATIYENPTSYTGWVNAKTWSSNDNSAAADPDQDGLDNFVEYALGSNPLDASSRDWLTITRSGANSVEVSFNRASAGVTYIVQYSTDLINWSTYAVNPGTTGSTVSLVIPELNDKIFLRLRLTE